MRLLDFSVWFIWRACWSSGVFSGKFHWTVWIGIWSWWGDFWKWGAEVSLQERRPHGYPWELFFITYKSISPFKCVHVLATSLCLGANEERPVRFGQEKVSTGIESESQIRLKKAIVRRHLAPLSKGRDCKERSYLYQCWSEPHLLEAGFWWGQCFGFFVEISSSVPHLIPIAPCFRVIDQFTADPASTSTNVTGTSSCLLSVCFHSFHELLCWF